MLKADAETLYLISQRLIKLKEINLAIYCYKLILIKLDDIGFMINLKFTEVFIN